MKSNYPVGNNKDQRKEVKENRDHRGGRGTSRFMVLADMEETEGQDHKCDGNSVKEAGGAVKSDQKFTGKETQNIAGGGKKVRKLATWDRYHRLWGQPLDRGAKRI